MESAAASDSTVTCSCRVQAQPWHGLREQEQTCRCTREARQWGESWVRAQKTLCSCHRVTRATRSHAPQRREGRARQVTSIGVQTWSPSVIRKRFLTLIRCADENAAGTRLGGAGASLQAANPPPVQLRGEATGACCITQRHKQHPEHICRSLTEPSSPQQSVFIWLISFEALKQSPNCF